MANGEYQQTMFRMRQELASIQRRAESICLRSQKLVRQAESAKVESLQKLLERKIEEEIVGGEWRQSLGTRSDCQLASR
jgi:hypothetical protein